MLFRGLFVVLSVRHAKWGVEKKMQAGRRQLACQCVLFGHYPQINDALKGCIFVLHVYVRMVLLARAIG